MNLNKKLIFVFIFLMSFGLLGQAYAGDNDNPTSGGGDKGLDDATANLTQVLCNVINVIQGTTGKTICIIVIITLSIGLFLGKVTWGVAIAVAVGMGVLFGAGQLVGYLAHNQTDTSTANPCEAYKS
jgi:type IV secretion system protein VirB2